MTPGDLTQALKTEARELGFALVGVARARPLPEESDRLRQWLRQGFAAGMAWMERRVRERTIVTEYFPGVHSIVVVAENYFTGRAEERLAAYPDLKISNYAWGKDYHRTMKSRLEKLGRWLQDRCPEAQVRICVDTSPVLEKAWAVKAGLGWQGKHTNLITREVGSWVFLGELLTDLVLRPDDPFEQDFCGTCRACLDACPTRALTEYQLDARKCISYLTIEHKGAFSAEMPEDFDHWIYGCDVCQEVCPWNHSRETLTSHPAYQPQSDIAGWQAEDWLSMSREQFRTVFRESPLRRTGYDRLQRNIRQGRGGEPGVAIARDQKIE